MYSWFGCFVCVISLTTVKSRLAYFNALIITAVSTPPVYAHFIGISGNCSARNTSHWHMVSSASVLSIRCSVLSSLSYHSGSVYLMFRPWSYDMLLNWCMRLCSGTQLATRSSISSVHMGNVRRSEVSSVHPPSLTAMVQLLPCMPLWKHTESPCDDCFQPLSILITQPESS